MAALAFLGARLRLLVVSGQPIGVRIDAGDFPELVHDLQSVLEQAAKQAVG
jgi:hypothetical protein